jgi:hypothetical protein
VLPRLTSKQMPPEAVLAEGEAKVEASGAAALALLQKVSPRDSRSSTSSLRSREGDDPTCVPHAADAHAVMQLSVVPAGATTPPRLEM